MGICSNTRLLNSVLIRLTSNVGLPIITRQADSPLPMDLTPMLDHELRNSCQNLLERITQLKDSL